MKHTRIDIFRHRLKKVGALRGSALGIGLFVLPLSALFAQESVRPSEKSDAPTAVAYEPAKTERADAEQYQIGSGDVLDIRIFNRPQLSRDAVRVDGRGQIRLPLIGEVRAACLTESQLEKSIAEPYREYLRNPHVEVFIKEYQSKPVMVIGAVRDAGQFQMRRRVRLLELLSLAGGLTEQADGRIQIKHAPDAPACGGSENTAETPPRERSVEWYDVADLLRQSGERVPYVEPGDTINLLEAEKAFIVGNVVRPSTVLLKEKTTVAEAVAAAGGVLPDSKLEKVRILRQTSENDKTKREIIIDLKAINKRQAEDIALQANDIVDVPTSSGKKFLRGLINSIAPTVSRSTVRVIP